MELISKISKGTRMDQIYLPKNRIGMRTGQYVLISPIEEGLIKKNEFKPFFRGINNLEPLKLTIIKSVFEILEKENPENIIITGSFLDKGFKFNDLDILFVKENKIDISKLKEKIENEIGIKIHLIPIENKTLTYGISTDPLYSLMLSKCISKKRIITNKRKINYKILDLNLLKSNSLIDNFDILNGEEKYYLTLNMIAILLFIQNEKLTKKLVEDSIEKTFNIKIEKIKYNLIEKSEFIKRYKEIYKKTFDLIMENIK